MFKRQPKSGIALLIYITWGIFLFYASLSHSKAVIDADRAIENFSKFLFFAYLASFTLMSILNKGQDRSDYLKFLGLVILIPLMLIIAAYGLYLSSPPTRLF